MECRPVAACVWLRLPTELPARPVAQPRSVLGRRRRRSVPPATARRPGGAGCAGLTAARLLLPAGHRWLVRSPTAFFRVMGVLRYQRDAQERSLL